MAQHCLGAKSIVYLSIKPEVRTIYDLLGILVSPLPWGLHNDASSAESKSSSTLLIRDFWGMRKAGRLVRGMFDEGGWDAGVETMAEARSK